ncbi:MAG: hypothetical protein EON52_04265 [Actinomycetales bacterium]|nr:MAG: hypothetical protein EON52_04265 [Actinomycetales bacterium]
MALRPLLRPGCTVLRRDPSHLQIGISPGITVRDRPGLVSFLHLLDGVHDVPALHDAVRRRSLDVGDVDSLLMELMARGVAVDPAATPDPGSPLPVRVLAVDPYSQELSRSIRAVCGEQARRGPENRVLVVAVCTSEPSRDAVDDLVERAGAVLLVRTDEERVNIGPFVVGARSPCLRCADHHRTDADPTWPHVLAQLEHHAGPSVAPRLRRLVAWQASLVVAAEAERWQLGERPSCLGSVNVVGPLPGEEHVIHVPFHPRCLCAVFPDR